MAEKTSGATALSKMGEALIKNCEQLRLKPYLDSAGVPTIGWGTTHYEDGRCVTMKDKAITTERAEQLFQCEARAKSYVFAQALQKNKIALRQNQFDACISLAYNIGIEGLLGSTLFRRMKVSTSDPAIRAAFVMWNKITVNEKRVVCSGLTVRRGKEADYYFG